MQKETKNKPTMRQQCDLAKAAVMRQLGWSAQKWAEFQYEQGLIYLDYYLLHARPETKRLMESSRTFWAWWMNHWRLRDESFLECCRHGLKTSTLEQIYLELHDGRKVSGDIYPHRAMLREIILNKKSHEAIHS